MKVIHAPNKINDEDKAKFKIFLAGSIEMGKAIEWQGEVTEALKDLDIIVLNPRRNFWSSGVEESIVDPRFKEQVDWELDSLESADLILCYIDPNTKSPITMLEIGLFAQSQKMIIGCPYGFWKRGNIEVVAERFGIELFSSLEELIKAGRERINKQIYAK